MEKSGGIRTQMSFLVSVMLHGGVVAFLALGPLFLTSKTTESERSTVSFTTTESPIETPAQEPAAAAAPAAPTMTEAPPPQPAQPVVAIKAPVTKKVPRTHIAKAKPAAPKVVAKQVIAPQEILPAENTETPLEKSETAPEVKAEDAQAPTKSDDIVVAKNEEKVDQVSGEPAPMTEAAPAEDAVSDETAVAAPDEDEVAPKANDSEFTGEKPQATPVTAPVVEDAPKAVPPPLPAPVINKAAAPAAAASAGNLATASSTAGITVTQSYTGLKQMSGNKPPAYTREMRMAQMQGVGQLVYFVNKDGSVSQMQLTKSTGYADLDQAAMDAFSKYKFVPGQEGFTVHNFEFSLKGPAISDVGRLRTTMK